jgi:hypothetical protein
MDRQDLFFSSLDLELSDRRLAVGGEDLWHGEPSSVRRLAGGLTII